MTFLVNLLQFTEFLDIIRHYLYKASENKVTLAGYMLGAILILVVLRQILVRRK